MNGFTRSSETYDEGLACLAAALWRLGQQDTARSVMQRFMLAKREKMTDYPGTDPAPDGIVEGIARDRWDVAVETTDGLVLVECGSIRERVSQELARAIYDAVKRAILDRM